jgi:tRNA threonylcarbamoyladenosine biosynthesis protein TsaE
MQSLSLEAESAVAMEQLAAGFAQVLVDCGAGLVITLQGPLGAGKTTWCRGLLRALGYQGVVKSPTYTLVESYKIEQPDMWVHHFDLYRMVDPEELEYIGGRDYFDAASVCLVEWPERGEGVLPPADIGIDIRYAHAGQDNGRCLTLTAQSAAGHQLFSRLRQQFV